MDLKHLELHLKQRCPQVFLKGSRSSCESCVTRRVTQVKTGEKSSFRHGGLVAEFLSNLETFRINFQYLHVKFSIPQKQGIFPQQRLKEIINLKPKK